MNREQLHKIAKGAGFIAALDQSGGSTPKALKVYGVDEGAYTSSDEMFDVIHRMRTRIISSPGFSGDRLIGAILFENTMDREIGGRGSAEYLWEVKGVVPFLKVDKGLAQEADGVQMMKEIPGLNALLDRALSHSIFGTKMRSVILLANSRGIDALVDQQFAIGKQILAAGLIPILEPEVSIHSPEKEAAEDLLRAAILRNLEEVPPDQQIMLKLTIPTKDNHYRVVAEHPKVLRVVALSGGYSRKEANERLACNAGVVASFSRGLTEGLTIHQTDDEFNKTLDSSIASIYDASVS